MSMLPKTFDPAAVEPRLYAAWEASGAFAPSDDPNAKPFCIVIPPPNVTGSLHIGHALNNTLQDILARFHRMRGEAVLWLPGTDHAGIATQMVVERQLAAEGNISRREMGREAFLERVWAWKAESAGAITNQLRRLGASCDWSRERFTMDPELQRAVTRVFVQLYQEGLIYRDKRLVNWDPHFQTAISDLEVEQREVDGHYWRFAYPLEDGSGEVVVATTRPETMLGDTAVAVHPDDERYRDMVGKFVILPIVGRRIKIIADAYADPEKGSGAVKITPAHDFNDFEIGRRHGLEFISVLDESAHMQHGVLSSVGRPDQGASNVNQFRDSDRLPDWLVGQDRERARRLVVKEMDRLVLLRGTEKVRHMVPHGDRSGGVIEPYLTDQWYVDAKTLARPAIAAVEDGRTVFEPRHWEKTYFEWMRNIEPWCVSRQLWWGHRIPVWFAFEWRDGLVIDGQPEFVADDVVGSLAAACEHYGCDVVLVQDISEASELARYHTLNSERGYRLVTLVQDQDVLDTWFSSQLWPFSTLGWPESTDDLRRFYPTDTLVTGFDIIFFWVARMMMAGLHFTGDVPFRRVVINGLVRDERGQKMSKSKGNVIDPLEIVDTLGADPLRFTMAILSGTRDIKLSKQRIEGYRNFGTKLWNAARFCQMNECRIDPEFDPAGVKLTVNRWIVGETAKASAEVTAALTAARFDEAAGALYRFVWNVFCDWYLELAKPVLGGADAAAQAETRVTAAWTLDQACKLLHPITPFITEELWGETAAFSGIERETMLISAPWPDLPLSLVDADAEAEIGWVIDLVTEVRSIRAEMNVPNAARPGLTVSGADAVTQAWLERQRALIVGLARVGSADVAEAPPAGSAPFALGEATGALAIAEFIDVAAETARLGKEAAGFEAGAERAANKLGNADFVARAREEVVQETRDKLAAAEASAARLRAALARLERVG